MKATPSAYALCIIALGIGACSGDDHPAPLAQGSGGSRASTGGRKSTTTATGGGGAGGASDAGASDSGTDDPKADGSGIPSADAGCVENLGNGPLPTTGPFVCSPGVVFGDGTHVASASTPADDAFGAITPDELTIMWSSTVNGVTALHYADRASKADPFDPAGTLSASDYYADERPALSPDGARVVVLRKDRKAFGEYTRTGRFFSFGDAPEESAFAAINNQGLILETDEYFGDPVLSSDDLAFYYSRYGAGDPSTVRQSTRTSPVGWPLGVPVAGDGLSDRCGHRRRPTGVSSDGLTLFYWDESSSSERATWRTKLDAPFSGFVELGQKANAQPSAACNALYYSANAADAASGADCFVASAK